MNNIHQLTLLHKSVLSVSGQISAEEGQFVRRSTWGRVRGIQEKGCWLAPTTLQWGNDLRVNDYRRK
jgi:hypothetical protein